MKCFICLSRREAADVAAVARRAFFYFYYFFFLLLFFFHILPPSFFSLQPVRNFSMHLFLFFLVPAHRHYSDVQRRIAVRTQRHTLSECPVHTGFTFVFSLRPYSNFFALSMLLLSLTFARQYSSVITWYAQ